MADENRENIIENLIVIEAKLQDINSLDKADLFLSDIYKNSLYKITIPNVSFWLRYAYNNQEQIEEDSLLSSVLILPTEPLSIYVSDHLDNLVGDILSNCPTVKFSDDQTIIRKILNSCTTSLETKRLYCDHLSSQIEDISKISDIEVIKLLLGNDLVKLNSNNLLALFNAFNKTFADELSMYLTKHENDWVKDKRINSTLYSNELVLEFFNTALNDTSLNKLVTETLLSATKIKITNQTAIVEEEKAKALISSRALVMNNNNLAYIRTNHPNLVLEFEKVNLELFKKVLDTENNTNAQEIVNLLESDINGREQINLLHHVNVKVPYKESYRYPGVKKQIINYLLDTSDIEKLIADPMAQAENLIFSTKTAIVKNIDFVIQNHLALPYTLFTELMITKLISQKNLVEVFVNSMDLYSPKAIRENILILQLSPFDKLFNRKHPKFESNEINLKILSVLEKKGIANMSHISGRLYLRG